MPRSNYFDESVLAKGQAFVARYRASPIAADDDYILVATDQPTTGTTKLLASQLTRSAPDVPRSLTVDGDQATCAGSLVIKGTNVWDDPIEETIGINGTTIVQGVRAFKAITEVTIPTRGAAGDSIFIGIGDKLGRHQLCARPVHLATFLNGVLEGTAPTVVADSDEVEKNTFDLNSALNGTEVESYYVTD